MPELHTLVDQSLLRADTSREEIQAAIKEAKLNHYNSICVRPKFLKEFSSEYRISAVIGFPKDFINSNVSDGKITDTRDLNRSREIICLPSIPSKVVEARQALEDGAMELDPVINIQDLSPEADLSLAFPGDKIRKELQIYLFLLREFILTDLDKEAGETVSAKGKNPSLNLKPIFSCEILSETELELSIQIFAEEVLAFYDEFPETLNKIKCSYKNSTGFIKSNDGTALELASPKLIAKIAAELDKYDSHKLIGIKAAGGIRDISTARAVEQAANGRLTHIGTSAGEALIEGTKSDKASTY